MTRDVETYVARASIERVTIVRVAVLLSLLLFAEEALDLSNPFDGGTGTIEKRRPRCIDEGSPSASEQLMSPLPEVRFW